MAGAARDSVLYTSVSITTCSMAHRVYTNDSDVGASAIFSLSVLLGQSTPAALHTSIWDLPVSTGLKASYNESSSLPDTARRQSPQQRKLSAPQHHHPAKEAHPPPFPPILVLHRDPKHPRSHLRDRLRPPERRVPPHPRRRPRGPEARAPAPVAARGGHARGRGRRLGGRARRARRGDRRVGTGARGVGGGAARGGASSQGGREAAGGRALVRAVAQRARDVSRVRDAGVQRAPARHPRGLGLVRGVLGHADQVPWAVGGQAGLVPARGEYDA